MKGRSSCRFLFRHPENLKWLTGLTGQQKLSGTSHFLDALLPSERGCGYPEYESPGGSGGLPTRTQLLNFYKSTGMGKVRSDTGLNRSTGRWPPSEWGCPQQSRPTAISETSTSSFLERGNAPVPFCHHKSEKTLPFPLWSSQLIATSKPRLTGCCISALLGGCTGTPISANDHIVSRTFLWAATPRRKQPPLLRTTSCAAVGSTNLCQLGANWGGKELSAHLSTLTPKFYALAWV